MNDVNIKNESLDIPVEIFLNKVKKISQKVKNNVGMMFILKGNTDVAVNNQQFCLKENDVLLINNGDVYELCSNEDNLVLSIEIENDFWDETTKKEQKLILCNSSINKNKNYDEIRKIMAKIMYEYSNREYGYKLKIMSLLYDLIYLLNLNFTIEENNKLQDINIKDSKYSQRINNIVTYIKQNYYQQISLQDVADSEFLTPEYLSKFFRVHLGMTFSKYLNEFRLSQAVKELLRTDNSVTKVAMNNGFPNLVSFNKIFREVYDTTPADYRSQVRKKQAYSEKIEEKIEEDIIRVDYNIALEKLTQYVDKDVNVKENNKEYNVLEVAAEAKEEKLLYHFWKNLINLGYAQDGLRSDLQQHLTDVQKRIKFKYARFQGIFSDEMLSYGDEAANEKNYNFTKIDKLIDFLYSINLKPFIELGNKAKLLNRDYADVMYFRNSSKGQRNNKETLILLEKFIVHCINRYGLDEVSQWYFEVWKKGDNDYVIWNGDFEKYINKFKSYYNLIKKIVPNAKVGGPGFNPEVNMKLFSKFLNEMVKTETKIDFISVSLYNYELIEDSKINKSNAKFNSSFKSENLDYYPPLLSSTDRNYCKVKLDKIKKLIKQSNLAIKEIHVTEYNSSISHRHPANDTTFKAAFIVKNIVDNLDEVESFGYWFCSDISGELKDSKDLLYGDMGIISTNGIYKPGFFAYEMLSRLGEYLIQKGNGYIITKKSAYNYAVIAYNYKHFNDFYCLNGEASISSLDEYYSIYEDQKDLNIKISLKGVNNGRYRIKKYILNRNHGSIFDEWLKMNAINNIKKDEIEYLKQICIPKQTVFYEEVNEQLNLNCILSPHEVNFFDISFEYR
jgi:xylan 1,4-beta-xylosidase